MADLLFTPEAEADLDNIWLYIAKESQSIERAELTPDRFSIVFSRLTSNPYMGRKRDDIRPGYRSFPVGSYIVFYRLIGADQILVLRVVHGRRDLEQVFT